MIKNYLKEYLIFIVPFIAAALAQVIKNFPKTKRPRIESQKIF